jgi:transcriptional regulator with XRE-family HTH domain
MAGCGNVDQETIRLGEELERLRNARGLTRSTVVNQLRNILDVDDPDYENTSEGWLANIEKGRKVKVRREIIEALFKVFACSLSEKANILLLAGRSMLPKMGGLSDQFARLLNVLMSLIHDEILGIIASIPEDQAQNLSPAEMDEIIFSAIQLVIKDYRSEE